MVDKTARVNLTLVNLTLEANGNNWCRSVPKLLLVLVYIYHFLLHTSITGNLHSLSTYQFLFTRIMLCLSIYTFLEYYTKAVQT